MDKGYLILSEDEKEDIIGKYPDAECLFKRISGSLEFLRSETRYCLWITDDLLEKAKSIPEVKERISKVKEFRESSKRANTADTADVPWRFSLISYQPEKFIIIPRVSSENREYIPIGYLDASTVILDSAFAIYKADYWLFGILSSKMHNVWVGAVGGRLKSDLRYSATLCYNTFPVPNLSDNQRKVISELAKKVIIARAGHTEMTLGDMYNYNNFPQDLRAAHHALDLAVEHCYREKPFESDEERLEYLFKQYVKLTTDKSTLWKI